MWPPSLKGHMLALTHSESQDDSKVHGSLELPTRSASGLTLFSSVNLISLWATNALCWGCPGGACWGVEDCWADLPPAESFEDLGCWVDESLFRLSSLMPSSFLDFPADEKCLVTVTEPV